MKTPVALLFVLLAASVAVGAPWVCSLPDTAWVDSPAVTLGDIVNQAVPEAMAQVVVGQAGKPGRISTLGRHHILRTLVSEGRASGVRFLGATSITVIRVGAQLDQDAVRTQVHSLLRRMMPEEQPGAPASSLEWRLPESLPEINHDAPDLAIRPANQLQPGRNHRELVFGGEGMETRIPLTITLHHYGEAAKARMRVSRGDPLNETLFDWEWVDLGAAQKPTDLFGRDALVGSCCRRTLQAGNHLQASDLKPEPVIRAGDRVELTLYRGTVSVSVPATARQEGPLGKVIPVRNELTNRLVNARIVGPGSVEWR